MSVSYVACVIKALRLTVSAYLLVKRCGEAGKDTNGSIASQSWYRFFFVRKSVEGLQNTFYSRLTLPHFRIVLTRFFFFFGNFEEFCRELGFNLVAMMIWKWNWYAKLFILSYGRPNEPISNTPGTLDTMQSFNLLSTFIYFLPV